ncbi:GroES-like protein [Cristinia sonorae]|uniref:GroES-like protein n=1 Tax=Cristinia sonorae TaxID=1940300 RepID=A0A8K0XPR0_9AGAR|nr:GroES-like protein [Cristinia sonorae]
MSIIPETMKAAVVQADKTMTIVDVPVPSIDETEILVRTTAVAQNPTDWKHVRLMTHPGTIVGVDFAGVVVKIGDAVSGVSVGDRVAGFVHGGQYKDRGAFAEYVKAAGDLVWKIPEGTSDEQAAAVNVGAWTAAQMLFSPRYLNLIEPPEKVTGVEWVFIYGGSTSVGLYAIQLAHLAGYKVATVASPKNHALLKTYGADVVHDYRDPDAISKVKAATNDSIHYGIDTISELETQKFSVQVLAEGPGKIVVSLGIYPEATQLRSDVEFSNSLLYTVLNREFYNAAFGGTMPAFPEDNKHMVNFVKKLPELVKSGALLPNPLKYFDGGLSGINAGFDYMIAGKNSAEKIVFRI